ncbi:RES family NAD+ phosphorylase [Streptomyces sp. WM6378]|uniref:RES family NAD+ phosphorylase n=1 Tax=Streptomyces sp. WM6378 TaxID=1415557 RepID=UPI0006AF46DB|nr:RES family NAD+ phosphorylase [Streptomyces sp. WM6378]KOU54206.1 hypothetical protein ADK54_02320 [Streptomyces sp. WM6378]
MDQAAPSPDIQLVEAPERGIWRLGRATGPLKYERITEADDASSVGNRWSHSDHGTLYCASEHDGCFAEALAGFRVHPDMRDVIGDDWPGPYYLAPGTIPRDWRTRHGLVRLQPAKGSLFLDVDDHRTLRALSEALQDELAALDVDKLTTEHIQGFKDRRVTRQISIWAVQQRTAHQEHLIQGIAYRSLFGMRQCWAVFDHAQLEQVESSLIFPEAEALRTVADEYGLTVF